MTRGRRIAVGALIGFATLFAVLACFGIWAKRQALDEDNWVDTSTQLLENEQIRTAIGLYLVDQLYDSQAVEQRLTDALPPRLDPAAPAVANGLKELAKRNAPRLLGTAAALSAWKNANRAAFQTFDKVVHGDLPKGEVTLDLRSMAEELAGGTGVGKQVAQRLPPDAVQLRVLKEDQVDSLQKAVDLLEKLAVVLFILMLLCFAGAVYLSADRRRTLVTVGSCLVLAGIIVLAVRRLAGREIVDALAQAPNATGAADDAWKIGTSMLVDVAWGGIVAGIIITFAAWLSGPARWAASARRAAAPWLRDYPVGARIAVGTLIVLLVIWGPVPWTGRVIPILILAIAAFVWLEWLRRLTAEEFPGAGAAPAQ